MIDVRTRAGNELCRLSRAVARVDRDRQLERTFRGLQSYPANRQNFACQGPSRRCGAITQERETHLTFAVPAKRKRNRGFSKGCDLPPA